jgi:hypothetical protein
MGAGERSERQAICDVMESGLNERDFAFALELEAQASQHLNGRRDVSRIEENWETWLRTLGPNTFTGSFASFHRDFWGWYWRITGKRRLGLPLIDEEKVFLAIWMRGGGKSSNVEWAAIAEGALVGKGYVLYVSGTQALADAHVSSIRDRLEGNEIGLYYPGLGDPQIGKHGNQKGWSRDFLQTANGWAVRPIGLDVGVRGGKVGDQRPSLIILDDVDSHEDSPAVVEKKLETLTRAIIPAGGPDTIILFGQNLIHRNSVLNQILTYRSSALSVRIPSGPFKAFEGLEIELKQTDRGPRNVIVAGEPTWKDFDLAACQTFLDNSGRESFYAEYQHDFEAIEEGRVIPEYDEKLHVITWTQFSTVYKWNNRIPPHWNRDVGHDVGFTKGHLSAWTWITTSAEDSELPGLSFRYRGLTFSETGCDEQALAVIGIMAAYGEKIGGQGYGNWRISHEAKSERMAYAKHGLHFLAAKSGKTDGVAQWRHCLRPDKSLPHPFHKDEKLPDGTWKLGRPSLYDIVDDDQFYEPRDDKGLKTHRLQLLDWKYAPDRISVTGMLDAVPMKVFEDTVDSSRMILAEWPAGPAPLTEAQRMEKRLPEALRADKVEALTGWAADSANMRRGFELAKLKRADQEQGDNWSNDVVGGGTEPNWGSDDKAW